MNAPVKVVVSSQWPPTISPEGRAAARWMWTRMPVFGQGLYVSLCADEFKVFVYGGALELRGAVFVTAEVPQVELAQAADAGCDGGLADAVGEGELLKASDEGFVGAEAEVRHAGCVDFPGLSCHERVFLSDGW